MLRRTLFQSILLPFIKVVDLPVWGVRCEVCYGNDEESWYDKDINHQGKASRMTRAEAQKVIDFFVDPSVTLLVFLP